MLADIAIENLGVIPSATAELSDGLTVLTGETGAGKTMVVTGLRLLTGGRADASRVRTGAGQAVVEGRFVTDRLPGDAARRTADTVESAGGTADENGEFIASRTVNATGRSRAHLGGRSVPAATLAEFSRELLTIHGQNDQLRLLAPDQQLAALDRFDPAIAPLLEAYRTTWRQWRTLARDLKERTESRRELAQEVDRLQFALNEIDEASPEPGEDLELVNQIRRLQDVDTLREQASTALGAIDGPEAFGGYSDEEPASTLLGRAESALTGSEDPKLREAGEKLSEITTLLSEISVDLGAYLSDLPADPNLLEEYLQRQQQLKQLTRKYAPDIDGVLAWREKAQARLSRIDISSEALDELKKQVAAAEQTMTAAAKKLTTARTKAAKKLGKQVTTELRGLAMPKARIEVEVRAIAPGRDGADEVELLLAANSSAEARPLASSASGGELSRVMLALEVILSAGSEGATLVFDEVDAGVGGRAAVEIGRRLARLATRNQVIVVTHLPQVAAYADTHLHVAKNVGDDAVTSGVVTLTGDERVEELARMLAGLDDTDTGRAHAAELLERAHAERAGFRHD
ncbi:DNA repair protein RecN [Corynebacterium halotolerans]|uniref:DNA repair protein RecN n=1 Tax=Corynebacterium halotolerans YIM 70093 = DSM 44683 TaxID=1121362 RepID=M1NY12_9CORY|nr:DNA repair protein RecN [Corynebacterium halotolerans]AGF72385.1 DNA repair protein RECN [Corynebacterium halotolerans YIM 70093 = DSM 44683]